MKKTKLLSFILLFPLLISCSFENKDLNELNDILYVSRNQADMPVYIHGNMSSNVLILVLHGGPGGSGLLYRPGVFADELESDYAVAYLDQRGQGMAQGHLNRDIITVEEMVEDVKAVIDVIRNKYGSGLSIFLYGHSWGGTLGTAFMATGNYQELVQGWIESNGAHDFPTMIKAQVNLFNEVAAKQILLGNHIEFWENVLDTFAKVDTFNLNDDNFYRLNSLSYKAESKLLLDSILSYGSLDIQDIGVYFSSLLFTENPVTSFFTGRITNYILANSHNLFSSDYSQQLKLIQKPTLLLWGKYDFVVPPRLAYQALNSINTEDIELVIFEESGHSPMVNEGEMYVQRMKEFINKYR